MAGRLTTGRVVVLNGSSSAGKSSLALALQTELERRGEPWVVFGWDDFVPRLPARWHGGPEVVHDLADDGIRYRLVGEGTAILEPGPVARRLLEAYHRAVGAIAGAGVDVLVDEVLMTAGEWDDWQAALRGLQVHWVGVRCPPDVVAARERARGDRFVGLARGTAERVHLHATYDVEVDTSTASPAELAARLIHQLDLM